MGKFTLPGNRAAAAYRQVPEGIELCQGDEFWTWGRKSMKILRRKCMQLAALSVVLASVAAFFEPAWPQAGRPVRVIIPFPPGGSADVLARILGQQIGEANNQTVIVENHPGAGASIAYELTARAAPDGNSRTRSRKPSTNNGHRLHNVRPPQLAASFISNQVRKNPDWKRLHMIDVSQCDRRPLGHPICFIDVFRSLSCRQGIILHRVCSPCSRWRP